MTLSISSDILNPSVPETYTLSKRIVNSYLNYDFTDLLSSDSYSTETLTFGEIFSPTLWDIITAEGDSAFVSTRDGDGNGIAGVNTGFVDVAGFSFDVDYQLTAVPVPAALWLFITGFAALLPMFKKKRSS